MYRSFRHLAATALLALLPVLAAGADPAPGNADLWQQAQDIVEKSRGLVADSVTTEMEMFDGDASMGTMRIEERISSWKDHEPVRVVYSNDHPEHEAVAKIRFKVMIDNHPEAALLPEHASTERTETASLNGKACTIFYLSGMTGAKGDASFKSAVWVEDATGLPLKVFTEFHGLPSIKSMTREIQFGEKDGQWLPASAIVDSTGSLLFKKVRFVAKYQFGNWVPRPKDM
jgi:hypothetical protein